MNSDWWFQVWSMVCPSYVGRWSLKLKPLRWYWLVLWWWESQCCGCVQNVRNSLHILDDLKVFQKIPKIVGGDPRMIIPRWPFNYYYSALAIISSLFGNIGRVCVRWVSSEAESRVGLSALSVDAPAGVVGEACGEAATWEHPILATHHLRVNSVKTWWNYLYATVYIDYIHHYTFVYYIFVAYN